ncbi:hypothetical protein BB561_006938, partial [Smittium simulii]
MKIISILPYSLFLCNVFSKIELIGPPNKYFEMLAAIFDLGIMDGECTVSPLKNICKIDDTYLSKLSCYVQKTTESTKGGFYIPSDPNNSGLYCKQADEIYNAANKSVPVPNGTQKITSLVVEMPNLTQLYNMMKELKIPILEKHITPGKDKTLIDIYKESDRNKIS